MGKQNPKLNIPMCAALVLLLLTMISIHLTSGLYARYTANSTASDSARVAKFDVEADVQPVEDKEGEFTLIITNNSEVAVKYGIEFITTAPLDAAIENAEKSKPTDDKIIFTNNNWTLAPGTNSAAHTLKLNVTNWVGITSETAYQETEPVDFTFTVNVTAEQID